MVWLDRLTYRIVSSPLLWGAVAATALQWWVRQAGANLPPAWQRSLTGGWDAYLCTTLFCVALSCLVVRAVELALEVLALQRFSTSADGEPSSPQQLTRLVDGMLAKAWARRTTWCQNVKQVAQWMGRPGDDRDVSQSLQEMVNGDFDRLRSRYSLVRLMVWSIPSVGSVATILAISQAVGLLAPGNSDSMLATVGSALSAAFQTFAFTLGLSVLLVMMRGLVEQWDQRVLLEIDRRLVEYAAQLKPLKTSSSEVAVQDQLRQLAEGIRALSMTLTQQAVSSPVASGAASVAQHASSATAMDLKDVEMLVQRAVAAVAERAPMNGGAAGGSTIDAAGWSSLQQVLQKLTHVLELQNAKLETEGRVSKQLNAIIDAGLSETRPALRVRNSA